MKTTANQKKNVFGRILGAALLFLSLLPSTGFAVTPAGTVIGNQATATYADASGNSFTTQSNVFSVTVSQVAGVSLTPAAGQSLSGVAGNQVQFPHTLTNTGNGTDTFNLTTVPGGAFTLGSIAIFQDNNGDGLANPGEPVITSLSLPMNGSQMIVVRGTIPGTASNGTSGTINVTATSVFNGTKTASSTDTANVVSTAIISLAKSVSAASVNPGQTLDYTLNYTNVGIQSASGVPVILDGSPVTRHVVRDVLPSNTTFAAFLGSPTPSGGSLGYHATGAAEDTYVTTQPASFDAVAYLFSGSMVGGQSGTFSFRVTVNSAAPVGTISNTSVMKFNNGSSATSQTSNTTVTSVNLVPAVDLYDTDGGAPDIQEVASGNAGSAITFRNEVENRGNGPDRFNITIGAPNTFPAGTVFTFLKEDGVTPLLDSNADGIVDTGLLSTFNTLTFLLKAVLPASATGGPFVATVTATSVANSTVSNSVTDRLNTVVLAGVDLTGPASVSGNPGQTINVSIVIDNTGPSLDAFDLHFSATNTPSFVPGTLPTDITAITFFADNGSGSPTGGPITHTGSVATSTNKTIIAQVTLKSSAGGGAINTIFFRGISPTSNASDVLQSTLTVNTVRSIALQMNQSNQTSPGGAALYPHLLTNTGNVTEPTIILTATNSASGFVSSIYLDENGDGQINGSESTVSSLSGLPAGNSVSLIVRVAVPSSAANGAVDITTFTATPTGGPGTPPPAQANTDTTTIVTGQVQLTLSASPSGNQAPGTTITYTITYTNIGAAAANALVITNAIPVNTTYVLESMKLVTTPLTDAADSDAGELIDNNKSSVRFTLGNVAAGGTGTVSFKVTID